MEIRKSQAAMIIMVLTALVSCKSSPEKTSGLQLIGSEVLKEPPPAIVALTIMPAFLAKIIGWVVPPERLNGVVHCGGTYIRPGVILTAAHCAIELEGDSKGAQASGSDEEKAVKAEDLKYMVAGAYFQIEQQAVRVAIKKSLALAPGSDLALLFFDHKAFERTLKRRGLSVPDAIPLYLLEDEVPENAQLNVYGIGRTRFFVASQNNFLSQFVGDVIQVREGGIVQRDRISVQLHPDEDEKEGPSLRKFASTSEFHSFFWPRGVSRSFSENMEEYWQSSSWTEEGLRKALHESLGPA